MVFPRIDTDEGDHSHLAYFIHPLDPLEEAIRRDCYRSSQAETPAPPRTQQKEHAVMITHIEVSIVPPLDMRYDTAGDWELFDTNPTGQVLLVTVVKQEDSRAHMLVALHELVEALLCTQRGITTEMVDKFDFQAKTDDPGTEPGCPYGKEHAFASAIERLVAHEMGVDFKKYDEIISGQQYGKLNTEPAMFDV